MKWDITYDFRATVFCRDIVAKKSWIPQKTRIIFLSLNKAVRCNISATNFFCRYVVAITFLNMINMVELHDRL